ncbi:MAG: hypothetical protein ACLFR8_07105 [Alkalispirochaeta sp.]
MSWESTVTYYAEINRRRAGHSGPQTKHNRRRADHSGRQAEHDKKNKPEFVRRKNPLTYPDKIGYNTPIVTHDMGA